MVLYKRHGVGRDHWRMLPEEDRQHLGPGVSHSLEVGKESGSAKGTEQRELFILK